MYAALIYLQFAMPQTGKHAALNESITKRCYAPELDIEVSVCLLK
jgi:hypothetical protein